MWILPPFRDRDKFHPNTGSTFKYYSNVDCSDKLLALCSRRHISLCHITVTYSFKTAASSHSFHNCCTPSHEMFHCHFVTVLRYSHHHTKCLICDGPACLSLGCLTSSQDSVCSVSSSCDAPSVAPRLSCDAPSVTPRPSSSAPPVVLLSSPGLTVDSFPTSSLHFRSLKWNNHDCRYTSVH